MDFLMPKMNIGSQKDYFEGIDSRYYFYFRHNKALFTQRSQASVKSCTLPHTCKIIILFLVIEDEDKENEKKTMLRGICFQ